MALYKTDAIIIRARDYGEADKILTLFSPEYGRIQAIAKGVRKLKSKLRGGVQPLSYSVFQLYKGKNLDTVTQVEQKESFNWLSTDLERLTGAAYLAELVDAAIQENEKNQAAFLLILTCFHLFESIEPTLVIRCFEVKLLSILGYAPQLEDCVNCNRVTKGEKQYFSIELGGILCSECRYNDPECLTVRMGTLATMNYLMKADLRKLSRLKIPKPVAGELEQVVKRFLSAKLEKRFKSLDLLSKL